MSGVRHSVWLTLLVSALAALLILPSPEPERSPKPVDPLRAKIVQVDSRFIIRSELLRREHSRWLAQDAVAHVTRDTSLVTYVRTSDVPIAFEQRMRTLMAKGFALPRRDPTMRIIVVLTVDTGSVLAGVPVPSIKGRTASSDIFPPGAIAMDVCVEVVRAHNPGVLKPETKHEQMWWSIEPASACGWYAAYGAAGRGVAAWLDSTQYAPIARRNAPYSYDWWPYDFYGYPAGPKYVGRQWMGSSPSRFALAACAAGRDSSCGALMLSNIERYGDVIRSPDWMGQGRRLGVYANANAMNLLRRLQSEISPEQFTNFWKSDLPLPEAFKAARGISLTSWVRTQARAVVPPERDRAAPSLMAVLLLIVAAIGGLVLGTRAVGQRAGFA